MRKLNKLFLMGAIALGLVACNNEDVNGPVDGSKANTHVSVTLSLSATGERALPNDYNYIGEWAGQDQIKTVDIYLVDGATGTVSRSPFTVGTDYTIAGNVLTPTATAAIKTTAGGKAVYVVINTTSDIITALSSTTAATFDNAYKNVALGLANSGTATPVSTSASKLIGTATETAKEVIPMTNVSDVTINVSPNVTVTETLAASPKNRASVSVDRAVARVMVTKTDVATYTVGSIGTVSDVTWVLAQGENSLYVQRKADWTTPNYTWNPGTGSDDYITQAGGKYDYSGLFENYVATTQFGGTTVPTLADYASADETTIGANSFLDGKFILPNTHAYAAAPAAGGAYTGGYKKGNTAYVMVRAKFTPTTFAGTADLVPGDLPGTFYLGANGKFYHNYADALSAVHGVPGQTVAKYVGGKVLYYAWANPDNTTNWYNSPVIRNNIYHIHITGFKTIGTNWNPLYPEDPDAATPNNPDPKPNVPGVDEPTNPIDPTDPLTTPETWMSVNVAVLPWLVHSYEVNLGI